MLEPQLRKELMEPATAPPFVDLLDQPSVIGLDRPAESDLAAHRELHRLTIAPMTNSSGTSGPKVSPR